MNLFAVFVIVKIDGQYCATTRDKGKGKIGLPGGKIDQGEDYLTAAKREAEEEGFLVDNIDPTIVHSQLVDGKLCIWVKAQSATILRDYKEKHRIQNILVDKTEILNSGFGNENLKLD
jgi:predicted NUDIX family NTP pyrophosphohydrolase